MAILCAHRNNYLFWSDYQQRLIRTSSLNGVGVRTLVSSRLTRPCKSHICIPVHAKKWEIINTHTRAVANLTTPNVMATALYTHIHTLTHIHNIQQTTHMHACTQNALTTLHNFLPCVGHIAWDWINSKLYWTDTAQQEIEVYDFINSHRRVIIFTGNTSRPFSIVVDPQNR